MYFSDVGVAAVLVGLYLWSCAEGSAWPVIAVYWGPYMVSIAVQINIVVFALFRVVLVVFLSAIHVQ